MRRRTFIKATSGFTAAGLVASLSKPLLAFPQESMYKDTIGLQLWTVRDQIKANNCLLYTSPSPRDRTRSRMPSSA